MAVNPQDELEQGNDRANASSSTLEAMAC